MKKIKIKLLFGFFVAISWSGLHAQQVTTTAGGNASSIGGSVSYSIGQIVYKSNYTSIGSVSQGVQQPYEIYSVSGISENNGINILLSAYPNPTTNYLTLKVENYKTGNLIYQLYDMSGQLLIEQKVTSNETPIIMERYSNGSYILKIWDSTTELKSIKIIKNR